MVNSKKKILTTLALVTLFTPVFAFAWLQTNITVTVPSDKTIPATTVYIRYACNAGESLAGTTAKCPSSGQFQYLIPKTDEDNGYTIYKKSIDRGDLGLAALPDTGWKVVLKDAYYLTELSKPITKISDDTRILFDNTGDIVEPTSQTGTTDTGTSTDTSTEAKTSGSPLTLKYDGQGIPTIGIDSTKCPDGSTVYKSGILKGISCNNPLKTFDDVLTLVKNVILVFLLPLVGTIFLIMLIIGGILYITSRGNPQQLERAKKTLTAAIIGLIIVTLSYTIVLVFAEVIGGGVS